MDESVSGLKIKIFPSTKKKKSIVQDGVYNGNRFSEEKQLTIKLVNVNVC